MWIYWRADGKTNAQMFFSLILVTLPQLIRKNIRYFAVIINNKMYQIYIQYTTTEKIGEILCLFRNVISAYSRRGKQSCRCLFYNHETQVYVVFWPILNEYYVVSFLSVCMAGQKLQIWYDGILCLKFMITLHFNATPCKYSSLVSVVKLWIINSNGIAHLKINVFYWVHFIHYTSQEIIYEIQAIFLKSTQQNLIF